MVRLTVGAVALFLAGAALSAQDADPVKDKLLAAKGTYDNELKAIRKETEAWLDKREDAARKAGDKKLVDQIKSERKAFDESDESPPGLPTNAHQKSARARKVMEDAYRQAIKQYVATKKDAEATAMERDFLDFRKTGWQHVDASKATFKDDYLRLAPQSELPTVQKVGAFELVVVARTESENIRLRAQRGSCVIFNWEVNPRELRVTRPDGRDQTESGSLATARVTPLKPNTWYTIKWRITEDGMQVSVDGAVVFAEQKRYELTEPAPITVRTERSAVDIKELRVTPLRKGR